MTSIEVGRMLVQGPKVFWMSHWDERLPLSLQVVLVRGHDFTLLVNTGPPDDLTILNTRLAAANGEWGTLVREPRHDLVAQLAEHGVASADVSHVICTPFQAYATGGLHKFPQAQICLSKRGWLHYHSTHAHPHDRRELAFPEDVLVELVTKGWDRVRLLEDEDEPVPGVRTSWCGVHHRASLLVEVQTEAGVVVTSDAFFYYENVEDDHPLGIGESIEEGLAAYARVRRAADHVVPLYDPRVFERYPGGVIA